MYILTSPHYRQPFHKPSEHYALQAIAVAAEIGELLYLPVCMAGEEANENGTVVFALESKQLVKSPVYSTNLS